MINNHYKQYIWNDLIKLTFSCKKWSNWNEISMLKYKISRKNNKSITKQSLFFLRSIKSTLFIKQSIKKWSHVT